MNQIARRPLPFMTTDEFLAWPGDGSGRKFQLVDGEVRAMSPASRIHGIIQLTFGHLIILAIEAADLPLQALTGGAVIPGLNASTNVRVSDIVIGPNDDKRGDQIVDAPVLLVEVLSPGNSDDTRDNVRACATLPSVREIVVVHSARVLAEIHRRDAAGAWLADPDVVHPGERVTLASVALDTAIARIYARTWLREQAF